MLSSQSESLETDVFSSETDPLDVEKELRRLYNRKSLLDTLIRSLEQYQQMQSEPSVAPPRQAV